MIHCRLCGLDVSSRVGTLASLYTSSRSLHSVFSLLRLVFLLVTVLFQPSCHCWKYLPRPFYLKESSRPPSLNHLTLNQVVYFLFLQGAESLSVVFRAVLENRSCPHFTLLHLLATILFYVVLSPLSGISLFSTPTKCTEVLLLGCSPHCENIYGPVQKVYGVLWLSFKHHLC